MDFRDCAKITRRGLYNQREGAPYEIIVQKRRGNTLRFSFKKGGLYLLFLWASCLTNNDTDFMLGAIWYEQNMIYMGSKDNKELAIISNKGHRKSWLHDILAYLCLTYLTEQGCIQDLNKGGVSLWDRWTSANAKIVRIAEYEDASPIRSHYRHDENMTLRKIEEYCS